MLSVKQGGIKYHFLSLWYDLNPGMYLYIYIYKYNCYFLGCCFQLHDHLSSIFKTIQIRWTKHVGHCWRRRDKLISDIFLWTPYMDVLVLADQQELTYNSSGDSWEDLGVMDDRDEWRCPWCNGYCRRNGHDDMSSNPGRDWLHFT